MVKVGAFWEKVTANGETYFTGRFNEANLLLFPNKYKKTDDHPTLLMFVAEARQRKTAMNAADKAEVGDDD
jgi:hypothetical protein